MLKISLNNYYKYQNTNINRKSAAILQNFGSLKNDVFEKNTQSINFKSNKEYQTNEIANFLTNLGKTTIRQISPTLITGGVIEWMWEPNFIKLKELGLETIIDLRKDAKPEYKVKCENTGIEYFNFPISNMNDKNDAEYYIKNDEKTELSPEFLKNLKKFFDIVGTKNVYMGCQYGVDRTNTGIFLNYFLNPKSGINEPFKILSHFGENDIFPFIAGMTTVRKVFNAITPEQQKYLGIDYNNQFKENFNKKIDMLIEKNKIKISDEELKQFQL